MSTLIDEVDVVIVPGTTFSSTTHHHEKCVRPHIQQADSPQSPSSSTNTTTSGTIGCSTKTNCSTMEKYHEILEESELLAGLESRPEVKTSFKKLEQNPLTASFDSDCDPNMKDVEGLQLEEEPLQTPEAFKGPSVDLPLFSPCNVLEGNTTDDRGLQPILSIETVATIEGEASAVHREHTQ